MGYTAANTSLIGPTGVASRRAGMAAGAIMATLALIPKLAALLLAILTPAALREIDAFLRELAAAMDWNEAAARRLRAAGEEMLAILMARSDAEPGEPDGTRHLLVTARPNTGAARIEFLAAVAGENLQDRVAHLSEQPAAPDELDLPLRLLRHYAAAV